MDGEKEKERERGEEKESDETEEDAEGAALLWQEGSSDDDLGLPIMHWEALSLRIAQLEKQEEERREKNKVRDAKSMFNDFSVMFLSPTTWAPCPAYLLFIFAPSTLKLMFWTPLFIKSDLLT